MKYYAKTYTADPKTGLLTPGEFLTEEQAAALGKERLTEMVKRGVLCAVGSDNAKAQTLAKSDDQDKPAADEDPDADDAEGDAGDGDNNTADDDPDGEEEELPELDGAGAIDEGDEQEEKSTKKPAKAAAKNGGGRNRK